MNKNERLRRQGEEEKASTHRAPGDLFKKSRAHHRETLNRPSKRVRGTRLPYESPLTRQIQLFLLRAEAIGRTASCLQAQLAAGTLLSAAIVTELLRDGVYEPLLGQLRLAKSILAKLEDPPRATHPHSSRNSRQETLRSRRIR